MAKKQYAETVDVARLAFWIKETKNGKMFLSGFAELQDGTKINLRVFKAEEKRNENSPDYFGSGSVNEEDEGLEVCLDEYEKREFKKSNRKSSTKQLRNKRNAEADVDDVPF